MFKLIFWAIAMTPAAIVIYYTIEIWSALTGILSALPH